MHAHSTASEIPKITQTDQTKNAISPFDQAEAAFQVLRTLEVDYVQDHQVQLDKQIMLDGLRKWYDPQKQAYVKQAIKKDAEYLRTDGERDEPPLTFNLVARVNRKVAVAEIFDWTKAFGRLLGHEALIASDTYERYSPEQLSGFETNSPSPFIFRLVPNKWQHNQRLYANADEQNDTVKELQKTDPFLGYPDVVDDVFNWFTLYKKGDRFNDKWAYYRTYMRHSNMKKDAHNEVPSSLINRRSGTFYETKDQGVQPMLITSGTLAVDVARLVIK